MVYSKHIGFTLAPPDKYNANAVIQWLKEIEDEQRRLQEISRQFLDTRDVNLLIEFSTPSQDGDGRVKLKDSVQRPFVIFRIPSEEEKEFSTIMTREYGSDWLNYKIEAAKLINKNAKPQEVEDTEGVKWMAITGVGKEFFPFVNLKLKELSLELRKQDCIKIHTLLQRPTLNREPFNKRFSDNINTTKNINSNKCRV
jgi:hypothetical protein